MTVTDFQNQFVVRFFWFKIESLIVIASYLLGTIPFGYLVAKAQGHRYPAAWEREYWRD